MSKNTTSERIENEVVNSHARWVGEIRLYEKEAQKWETQGKKILRRYKDERNAYNSNKSKYNILWSNVQTLKPALYAQNPKPDIERRFKEKDPLGRVTANVLERSTAYFVGTDEFEEVMNDAVLDRLLPGRGTAWVRYVPHMRDVEMSGNEEVADEGAQVTDTAYAEADEPLQEVYNEEVCVDYVHWQDFGHNVARTEAEVYAKWRKSYLTRKELVERFGDKGAKVPLDYTPKGLDDEKIEADLKKATIYEIWDKNSKKAIWLHKDWPDILDERDDPLRLKDFFPCPASMLATTANDSLIPVPDYVQYQDQAEELDMLTSRISNITKALKVCGVYAGKSEAVQRLLVEGVENQLIPVEEWMMFAQSGGLKGVIEYFPVQEVAQTLLNLYEARDRVKSDLYEITGIADIIRGQSDPNETLGAQQIKGQFATLRLSSMQKEVQNFARGLVRITAQIIAEHFSIETIKQISGIKLFTMQEKAQIQAQMQQAQAMGQPMPVPEEMQELLDNPTWEEVEQLLRDEAMLGFRIDIETDSTIKQDEEAEKQSRVELLTAMSTFIQGAQAIQDPSMKIFMTQMLGFGVRGFKAGKQVEGAVDVLIQKIEKEASTPQQPQPSPEQVKAQADLQMEQMKDKRERDKAAMDQQTELQKAQLQEETQRQKNAIESQRAYQEHQDKLALERDKLNIDFMKTKYEADIAANIKMNEISNINSEV